MNVRDFFIEKGANILAPCPHNLKCPLIAPNWCHFTQRLQRTKLHKEAKSATLGYEDEKFSYLIVSKQLRTLNSNRILTKPKHRGGHIEFDICTNKGTHESVIISKKNKDLYSIAKKKEWSDLLDLY
jgi:ribosomal protein RSM22 (predicted rRNA methylase)